MGQRNESESIEGTIIAGAGDTSIDFGTKLTNVQSYTISNDGNTDMKYKINSIDEEDMTLKAGDTYTPPVPLDVTAMWISNPSISDINYRLWLFGVVEA